MGVAIQGKLGRVARYLPTVLVFAGLIGLGWWGQANEWKAPSFAELWGKGKERKADTHAPTDAEPPAPGPANDWCAKHELPLSQCTICRPEIAVTGNPPATNDPMVTKDPAAPTADPRTCQTHLLKVQFASKEAVLSSGIRVAAIRERPLVQHITANGVVDYDGTRVAHLAPRVPGTVWRVERQVGQPVRKGEVLAIVEAAEVGKARGDLLQALAVVEVKSKTLENLRKASAAVSERAIQEAELALREARLRFFIAQQALVNLGLPVHLEDLGPISEEELARRVRFSGLPDSLVQSLDPIKATANLLPLTAPFDGLVIGRDMVVGEPVSATQPHFVVADTRSMWVMLDVRQEDIRLVRLGQEVRFRLDSSTDDAVAGKVSWISTEVDEKTRTVHVRAEVPNPDGQLRAHTFGTGRILVREQAQAIVVPQEAVQWDGCCHIVFVRIDDRTFQVRKVRLGLRAGDLSEVRAGLLPGEVVATIGSHVLKSEIFKGRIGEGE